jgi:hypothetical protein
VAARNPQTFAKRAREQAVKERRDLKRARKAEAAAEREAARHPDPAQPHDGLPEPGQGIPPSPSSV